MKIRITEGQYNIKDIQQHSCVVFIVNKKICRQRIYQNCERNI